MRRELVLLLPFLAAWNPLESANKAIETGNARMKASKAEEALAQYDQAAKALAGEPGVHFDRGTALYALSRFDEATQEFLSATMAKPTGLKEASFYNLGNAFFKQYKFYDAIGAYRRALVLDPGDMKAKWNLELATKRKKENDEKNKQNDQPDKNKQDKNDKDKKKDDQSKQDKKDDQSKQDKKDDQSKQDKKDDQSKQDKKDDPSKQDQQQASQGQEKKDQQHKPPQDQKNGADNMPPESPQDMKEIEGVLDSLEKSPKELEKERAKLRMIRRAAPVKDW